ncbi:phage integrase family protein [Burkholderia ubonensis]|uniref:phage integrase family protein n=3 Tax=Burkholderia ubonensis TaxID=101571 RepID=UPI00349EC2FA
MTESPSSQAASPTRVRPGQASRNAASQLRRAPGPDAFYSERELVALYVDTYPPATSPALDRKVARNRRLRERQDAALTRMEASLVAAPQLGHTLDGWFDAKLVARLSAAGISTFADLLAQCRAWARSARNASPISSRTTRTASVTCRRSR